MDNVIRQKIMEHIHCMKIVRIWSLPSPHFPAFGLNTERYSASLRIQSECGKVWTRKKRNTDTLHVVVISIKRKNRIPDTDAIYKELTKEYFSNISADDTESQIKFMIDNGILENRSSNQGLGSFFILNSNIPILPGRNDIELEQLKLGFSPSLATRSQENFFVETPEICKQIDKTPEIFDYNDLNAKFVAIKGEIYGLKLEIKRLKECIEKINSK